MAEIDIWYVSDLARCNFRCKYCATAQPKRQENERPPQWLIAPEMHRHVVAWLIALPHVIRLRMSSVGEPFASKLYLESIARLSRATNIEFVEVLTNGSFRPHQLDALAAQGDLSKVSLWITFHHEFITPAAVVEAAAHARELGAFVVLNALVFPDNIEDVAELVERCRAHGIRVATGAGVNCNGAYSTRGLVPILDEQSPRAVELANCENSLGDAHGLSAKPKGQPCRAGCRYFYVNMDGRVYSCLTYFDISQRYSLGSILNPEFRLSPRAETFAPCLSSVQCRCPEDYQNLEAIQDQFSWPFPSLGLPVLKSHPDP